MMFYGAGSALRRYLIFGSSHLPRFPSVLLAISGVGFVTRTFAGILAPAHASPILLPSTEAGELLQPGPGVGARVPRNSRGFRPYAV